MKQINNKTEKPKAIEVKLIMVFNEEVKSITEEDIKTALEEMENLEETNTKIMDFKEVQE